MKRFSIVSNLNRSSQQVRPTLARDGFSLFDTSVGGCDGMWIWMWKPKKSNSGRPGEIFLGHPQRCKHIYFFFGLNLNETVTEHCLEYNLNQENCWYIFEKILMFLVCMSWYC